MADNSSPRDDHFDEVLKAAERIQSDPPLPPPIPSWYMKPLVDPPPYTDLDLIGVTIRVLAVLELSAGILVLLLGMGTQDSMFIVSGLSAALGSVFVYAFGSIVSLLRDIAQNTFRQTALLERQFNRR